MHRMVSPKKTPQQLILHLPPATLSGRLDMVFCCFDENGDGKISPVELHNCMRISAAKLSLEEAEEIVRSTDSDNDGMLSMDEFSRLVEGHEEEERTLQEAFGAYEMEGRGCITPDSLKRALEKLGGPTTIKKCREMIRRFDIDGDGVINFEELIYSLCLLFGFIALRKVCELVKNMELHTLFGAKEGRRMLKEVLKEYKK